MFLTCGFLDFSPKCPILKVELLPKKEYIKSKIKENDEEK